MPSVDFYQFFMYHSSIKIIIKVLLILKFLLMEHYYYLGVAVCCATIIIGSIIWVKVCERKRVKYENSASSAYSEKSCGVVESFSFDKCFNPFNMLLWDLHKVNVYNPRLRKPEENDKWFREHTCRLMHDGACLAYINHYGHLEETFWKNIEELGLKPEEDVKFQCLLISIDSVNYFPNFPNLLYHYIQHWNLLPNVKSVMDVDSRFENLRTRYILSKKRT